MESASDLNVIRNDIEDNLQPRLFFLLSTKTLPDSKSPKTNCDFYKRIQITNWFDNILKAHIFYISSDIKVSPILECQDLSTRNDLLDEYQVWLRMMDVKFTRSREFNDWILDILRD